MKLHEIYGRSLIKPYILDYPGDKSVVLPNLLVGLELEIENFNPEADRWFEGFSFTEDGSLRSTDGGIGIEAITAPVETQFVRDLLIGFFAEYNISPKNYTERCSTHVHANVDNLTPEQLATLCLIYQTVESLLFLYVGDERDKNIFCVPWNQCNLSYNIVQRVIDAPKSDSPFRNWQKYSALNLIPIVTQGSVEFRHLGGTCDIDKIMEWIALISCMFKYAQEVPLVVAQESIIQMNTVSNYREWLSSIFGKYTDLLMSPGFEKSLSSGVVDSKLMLMNPPKNTSKYIGRAVVNAPHDWDIQEGNEYRLEPLPPLTAAQVLEQVRARLDQNAQERADRFREIPPILRGAQAVEALRNAGLEQRPDAPRPRAPRRTA